MMLLVCSLRTLTNLNNVLQLGEVADFEVLTFNLELNFF
jgi:hypothetical protein